MVLLRWFFFSGAFLRRSTAHFCAIRRLIFALIASLKYLLGECLKSRDLVGVLNPSNGGLAKASSAGDISSSLKFLVVPRDGALVLPIRSASVSLAGQHFSSC